MKVSQIIYELIKTDFPTADVYLDHIDQQVDLKSDTGIVLIKDMTTTSKGSKDLTSSTRPYDSIYRIEVIGSKDAYMTLETLKDNIRDTMIGLSNTVITVSDFEREYNDGNDVAEIKRFIQDFSIKYR